LKSLLFALAIAPDKIGGMEAFATEMARQLRYRGDWRLILCFERQPSILVRDFLMAPGNVVLDVLPNQTAMGPSGINRFWRMLRKYRPALVLYTLGGVVRWWPLMARLAGVSRIVYHDGTSRTSISEYRARAHVRLLMLPLSASVCATKFVKACSDRERIVPSEKSRVIYNSVDLTRSHGDGEGFRQRYGIPKSRLIVLHVSWLIAVKGIDIALRAAQKALGVRNDLHFVFCGDGESREQYEQTASKMGISDHITWTGQIDDLPASGAFSAADIQIQCSRWHEAFCLAVAEGMSAGLPIIASRIGGLPELVVDGVNGFLFDPQDDVSLAKLILRLASDNDLRGRMGQEGRKRAIANYNLAKNINTWIDILLGVPPVSAVEADV
jgi:glycosyltransferase involved in cell wall biosynthesis